MIGIQVFGISDASTEEELKRITEDLHVLCQTAGDSKYYVAFSSDRMKWGLGAEIAAFVSGVPLDASGDAFGARVYEVLGAHFPAGTLIGIQLIEARPVVKLIKTS
ncbi:hypothetical protein HYW68_00180 [Candidatus Parcubacteria bacterium]|nr:hypothetical protein [Candidatus Parcubacteria bacterium]